VACAPKRKPDRRADRFVACGGVPVAKSTYVFAERPMSIFWTLDNPLPLSVFGAFSVLKQGR
jgi:hypothetical protein